MCSVSLREEKKNISARLKSFGEQRLWQLKSTEMLFCVFSMFQATKESHVTCPWLVSLKKS